MTRKTVLGALTVAAALAATVAGSVSGTAAAHSERGVAKQAAANKIVIWADREREAAVQRVASAWAARRGITVDVVQKGFGDIRTSLSTVQAENAPDVVVGAHDWTGEFAANGLVLPLFLKKTTQSQFPGYALDAFSYGTGAKRLYGIPVSLENVGLVVNTRVARVPKTFADLEKQALAFKKKASGNLAIAVPGGDAYHMYPFFSGLCGYIFGKNKSGNLDPRKIGLGDKTFLRNTPLITAWNKRGLLSSKIQYNDAKNAFLEGKAAFWITGPWEADAIKKAGIPWRIVQVPKLKCGSVPFLGSQGFFVTKFAATHGVVSAAKDLVGNYMAQSGSQAALAAANNRYPANVRAGKRVSDPMLAAFGKASKGGVPMPNIPQMASVWGELANAWVRSIKGDGAARASTAFATAARNIRNKIG